MNHTFIAILVLPIIFTFWAIVDLAHRDFASIKKKMLWGIFVVFVPYIGGPVYLIFGRRHGEKHTDNHNSRIQQNVDREEDEKKAE